MGFSDLQCSITRDPVMNSVHMTLYTKQDGQYYVVKPVSLELTKADGHCALTPTISLNGPSAEGFLQSLAKALDNQGIKTDSDHRVQGTLDATKVHLDDMRNLVYMLMGPQPQELI